MFWPVVADQRFGNGLGAGLDAPVAELSQNLGIALSRQDRVEDRQPGCPRQVADDMVQLKVHLIEGFVHMLHVGARHLHEVVSVSQDGAHLADRLGRAEGGAQKTDRMKVLQPLTIGDVRLTAGDIFHMVGIDEEDLEAPRFQDLKQRNPIDARGFHGHGIDGTLFQPVG